MCLSMQFLFPNFYKADVFIDAIFIRNFYFQFLFPKSIVLGWQSLNEILVMILNCC